LARRVLVGLLLLALLGPPFARPLMAAAECPSPDQDICALMTRMSPAEKVGQLFLVTFTGTNTGPDSDIYKLIHNSHVGGVVLLSSNGNIAPDTNTPGAVVSLTNSLQSIAYQTSIEPTPAPAPNEPPSAPPAPFIPLFIAIDHEGDGFPYTRIRNGLTPVPNNMAIGATWTITHAETVGRIVGQELSALGINMLLGPSLDVLDNPHPEGPGDLGTRTFGGDPYWVSVMGQAYIKGVHLGSEGRMAVVAKHFPGHGGSDRRTDEEVATVTKSLEQLKQIELAPFFAVTGGAEEPAQVADALLTSHIRYRGFQGNIRASTLPISFDQAAFSLLMSLPQFASWRQLGGVVVSDSLGVGAVKRFYDPSGKDFPNQVVARDAFLAGNDLLILSEFYKPGQANRQRQTIEETIDFFRRRYEEDAAFRTRVDQSLARILALKKKLYGLPGKTGGWALEQTQRGDPRDKVNLSRSLNAIFEIAQDAVTLISPPLEELTNRVPRPPVRDDYIVIFTDVREVAQCPPPRCQMRPLIARTALEEAILALRASSGEVDPSHIRSFSFADLQQFLGAPPSPTPAPSPTPTESPEATPSPEATSLPEVTPTPTTAAQVAEWLNRADWIIFAMLDIVPEVPESSVVKTFLAQRPDLASAKKVIVLAFNAPYYLDATETSKVAAYYGLYSKVGPFVDVAVRALFREITPRGASPVSIRSLGYDLTVQTQPDPGQVIALSVGTIESGGLATPSPEVLKIGTTLRLRAGPILDHNGHIVPDGTVAQFRRSYPAEGLELPPLTATTRRGIAEVDLPLDHVGQLEISVSAEPATRSIKLQITIPQSGTPPAVATVAPPPATPTPTPVPPTETPTPTPPSPTPTASPTPQPTPALSAGNAGPVSLGSLLVVLVGLGLVGAGSFWWGRHGGASLVGAIRLLLLSWLGGLIGYNYFALGLPGAEVLAESWGAWSVVALAWGSAVAALGGYMLLTRLRVRTSNRRERTRG
jgi:beta-N-acetylhexosaminidase